MRGCQHAIIVVCVLWCGLAAPGQEFSGGTGEANDPYLIASAQDLIDLGNTPAVYDKHFRLTADIDLSDTTFDRAAIAPVTWASGPWFFRGTPFAGVFDGNDHVIRNLHIQGDEYLGLFGGLAYGAVVRNLGLENSSIQGIHTLGNLAAYSAGTISRCYSIGAIAGTGEIGGLIAHNDGGRISECYSEGEIAATWDTVGGLIGSNSGTLWKCHSTMDVNTVEGFNVGGLIGSNSGDVLCCNSTGPVAGYGVFAGGLIGRNWRGRIWGCYSTGPVTAWSYVGGLIGDSGQSNLSCCYSTSTVTGHEIIGGLIGVNGSDISNCYSTGQVTTDVNAGGLIADNYGDVNNCFWDTEASGVAASAVGMGLTTAQMQEMGTYLGAGWDFAGERDNGTAETWQMPTTADYPRLSSFQGHEPARPGGQGTLTDPFVITNAYELGSIGYRPFASYRLEADLDLSGTTWSISPIPWFAGHFDGSGHVIDHLNIQGGAGLGLFGTLADNAIVSNLGLENANVESTADLAGTLAGENEGTLMNCYSTGTVAGNHQIGGLIGLNGGDVSNCYALNAVSARGYGGGLIGNNDGCTSNCYSAGQITGEDNEGGRGPTVGGLIGDNREGIVMRCYWDTETSGLAISNGGVGLTRSQMREADPYLNGGWDFVGEGDNGTSETWQIPQTGGYPRLSVFEGHEPVALEGQGTTAEPFLIRTAAELGSIGHRPLACYRLENDIDLSEITWTIAPVRWFGGPFDGNGRVIRNLHIDGASLVGLFGSLAASAVVADLGIEGGSVQGTDSYVGALAGRSDATLINCHSSGAVSGGNWGTGGLVGYNRSGTVLDCHNTGTVAGQESATGGLIGYNWGHVLRCRNAGEVTGGVSVGGLVGNNRGRVSTCHNRGTVNGDGGIVGYNWGTVSKCSSTGAIVGGDEIGGLVGRNNFGVVANCYSTSAVTGDNEVGGLVGDNEHGIVRDCYSAGAVSGKGNVGGLIGKSPGYEIGSFWDIEASGVSASAGGTGLTTAEMMDPEWIGLQGWADHPNWVLDPHQDYPRLAWEDTTGQMIPEPIVDWMVGQGTSEIPYEIDDISQLLTITKASLLRQKHIVLTADLDLAEIVWPQAVFPDFSGTFDGDGHIIKNLKVSGNSYLGIVGRLDEDGTILNLGLLDVDIAGRGDNVGGLVGYNLRGHVLNCYSTGRIAGDRNIGGLVGHNDRGNVSHCNSGCGVTGTVVGGLVGDNDGSVSHCYSFGETASEGSGRAGGLVGANSGSVSHCFSIAEVTAKRGAYAGGLVGVNYASVSDSYSTGTVRGENTVGGLVASNQHYGASVSNCYSAGTVIANNGNGGGLVGSDWYDGVVSSFWDIETSGQVESDGGLGLTTAEMQDIGTYLEAGWDFVGETDNGVDDLWWIDNGQNYPHLSWELPNVDPTDERQD